MITYFIIMILVAPVIGWCVGYTSRWTAGIERPEVRQKARAQVHWSLLVGIGPFLLIAVIGFRGLSSLGLFVVLVLIYFTAVISARRLLT
jgi:hypothetical protein